MFLRNKPIYSLIHIPCNRLNILDLNQKSAPSIIICDIYVSLFTASLWRPGQLSRYSALLQAVRSGDRIPVGTKFSTHYQIGPGTRPTSGSFSGVKPMVHGLNHQHPSIAEVKKTLELYIYFLSALSQHIIGRKLPLFYFIPLIMALNRPKHLGGIL